MTLVDALDRATNGVWFYGDHKDEVPNTAWSVIRERAGRVAGALAETGVRPGDAVGVACVEPRAFVEAFLGVVVSGAVPTPMASPSGLGSVDGWQRVARGILTASNARCLVTDAPATEALGDLEVGVPRFDLAALDGPERAARPPSGTPALLQFTSGSTSDPRGVVVSPENLAANLDAFSGPAGVAARADDVCVSWLPLYHDMGLIGQFLGSLWADVPLALLPPYTFLRRPMRWLSLLHRHRGTIAFAPAFAYLLLSRRAAESDLARLDLSAWRVAGCGAEPIDPGVLQAFADRFAPTGFRESAFLPCYGLAEHTLAVTFPPVGRGLVVERGTVGLGRPFPGHALWVVDERGDRVPDGVVGEIVASGPSVTPGRLGEAPTHGVLATGDLGFLDDGELFVCGRKKDLIIVRGRNYYPQDLERVAEEVVGVRSGGVAAFSVPTDGLEEVVVVLESPRPSPELVNEVTRRVAEAAALRVTVRVVPPRSLPRTSSGKLRRAEARARFLAQQLGASA